MRNIEKIKKQKSNTADIILYSVILGIIINIISNALESIFDVNPTVYLIIGGCTVVLLIIATLLYKVFKLNMYLIIKSSFIVDENNNNDILSVPNYKISEDMYEYLLSSFVENTAIQNLWTNGVFNNLVNEQFSENEIRNSNSGEIRNLFVELVEYCLLENLSIFIEDYFNSKNMRKNIITLSQNSLPDILLENRFLKLFSENPTNRSAFINLKTNDLENVVMMMGKGGAIYRRFSLNLPKYSKVFRKDKNTIIIDTKLFTLSLKVVFEGFNDFMEPEFYKYYIHKDWTDFSNYCFNVHVTVKYKLLSIFKIMDWKYYNWLDDYIEKLVHYCDIESFYKDINWDSAKTIIQILNYKN